MVREPTEQDFDQLMPLIRTAQKHTAFGEEPIDVTMVRRMIAFGTVMPDVFARVVEHRGRLVGFFYGVFTHSAWGTPMAQELVCWSMRETDRLLQMFREWAKGKGAKRLIISDESANKRYRQLLERSGFRPFAVTYSMEV